MVGTRSTLALNKAFRNLGERQQGYNSPQATRSHAYLDDRNSRNGAECARIRTGARTCLLAVNPSMNGRHWLSRRSPHTGRKNDAPQPLRCLWKPLALFNFLPLPTFYSLHSRQGMSMILRPLKWFYHEFGIASIHETGWNAWLIILARSCRMFAYGTNNLILGKSRHKSRCSDILALKTAGCLSTRQTQLTSSRVSCPIRTSVTSHSNLLLRPQLL